MKTRKLSVFTWVAALGLVASAWIPKVQAQDVEITGPLAGAPAVMNMRLYRQYRFQIKAHAAMTLQDEFTRHVMFGGQLAFHLTDWLGIGVWGAFAPIHLDTHLTEEIQEKGQRNDRNVMSLPERENFPDQIGKISYAIAPQVMFIPLRGKLGLLERLFVDTDFFVFAGAAFVGVEERDDVPSSVCNAVGEQACLNSQTARVTRFAIAPTFGAGLSLYLAEFLALTIEWRGLPFAWNTSGTDEAGDDRGPFPDGEIDSEDRLFHFNHMVNLGLAFYLPVAPDLTHTEQQN